MYSTAKDYLKMMTVLLNGKAPDGTRVMRASTARLLTSVVMSHQYDEHETLLNGGLARVIPSFRTLGGEVNPQRVHMMPTSAAYEDGHYTWGDRGGALNG